MNIHTLGPMAATSLPYRPRDGQWRSAILCKLTHQLLPGQTSLAPTPEPITPEDLVPIKPHVDVLLLGTAYAPRGAPARSIPVRLIVGELDKSLEACCPRKLTADGVPQDGALVKSVPLRWELAAGGPGTTNPVGISQDISPAFGDRVLPQIQPLGWFSPDPGDPIPTVGFGPIPASWPSRLERLQNLGDRARAILAGDFLHEALGNSFDLLFFQAAPPDQQLEALRPDERIVLENLLPNLPRLVTSLSGIQPRAFLQGDAGELVAIPLKADTLCIDADRGLCTVTYRGHVEQTTPNEAHTVFIALEELGHALGVKELEARLVALGALAPKTPRRPLAEPVASFDPDATTEINSANLRPALPFQKREKSPPAANVDDGDDEPLTAVRNVAGLRAELGHAAALTGPAETSPEDTPPNLIHSAALVRSPVLPFVNSQASPQAPPQAPRLAPPPAPPMPTGPLPPAPSFGPPPTNLRQSSTGLPAWVVQPNPAAPPQPPESVWAMRSAPVGPTASAPPSLPTPPHAPAAQAAAAPLPAPWDQRRTGANPAVTPPAPSSSPGLSPPQAAPKHDESAPQNLSAAGYAGALAASNAAASREEVAAKEATAQADAASREPGERYAGKPIELIWYDASFVARMRKHPQWGPMFKPPPKPSAPERGKPPPPPPSAEAIEEAQRADLFQIVSRCNPSSQGELTPSHGDSDSSDAPLDLIAGILSFPLDEIELLKATAAAAAPLAANDKKLKEVLDLVDGVLKMPLEGAPEVTTSFVQRVRDAWLSANRMLPPDYIVTHSERMLLNQRQYQKRELLDQEWVRALFSFSSSAEGSASAVPAYVPAKLSKRLPLFRQFSARLIVEVLPQQDMYESSPIALRVVALARLLDGAAQPSKPRS